VNNGVASQMDHQHFFDFAQVLKNDGNQLIAQGFSYRALFKYQRALELIAKFAPQARGPSLPQGFPPNVPAAAPDHIPMDAKSHALRCILLSNVAACFLRMRKWNAVISACNELLEKTAEPVAPDIRLKTLVRRCRACSELGDWETALVDATAVKLESADAWTGLGEVIKKCLEMKQLHAARQRSV
jgi:hypothetical protein